MRGSKSTVLCVLRVCIYELCFVMMLRAVLCCGSFVHFQRRLKIVVPTDTFFFEYGLQRSHTESVIRRQRMIGA